MVGSAEAGLNLSEYGKGNTERGDRELRTRKSRWLLSLCRRFGCKTLCSVWACRLRFAHAAGHGSGLPPCRTAMIISRVSPAVSRRASHRSGRAQLRHPARLVVASRALCCLWSFREPWIEVQSPRTVARPQFRDQAPPSLHRVLAARVPRLPRYYEALRFPTARPVALRFLRAAVTAPCACVRRSVKSDADLRPGVFGSGNPDKDQ